MGFCEVLDRVVALLRERGRVTYRGLKREFQLDDAGLEDLKDELINAQRLAVEEQGAVLVWTGTSPGAESGNRQQAEADRLLADVYAQAGSSRRGWPAWTRHWRPRRPRDNADRGGDLLPAGPGCGPPPGARSLELRAAMNFGRLWHQQGKRQTAHDLLAHVYAWFTEGYGNPGAALGFTAGKTV